MATIEREFYRSARGPAPTDEDTWRLVFDPRAMRILVLHEWEAAGRVLRRLKGRRGEAGSNGPFKGDLSSTTQGTQHIVDV